MKSQSQIEQRPSVGLRCLWCGHGDYKPEHRAEEDSRSSSGYANDGRHALVEWMKKTCQNEIEGGHITAFLAGYNSGRADAGNSHTGALTGEHNEEGNKTMPKSKSNKPAPPNGASKLPSVRVHRLARPHRDNGRDVFQLIVACKAIEATSPQMRRATLEFLWDKFVVHPKSA